MGNSNKEIVMPDVVLSSTCFREDNLPQLCSHLTTHQIKSIELSGNIEHLEDARLYDVLRRYQNNIQFYVHNYFPAPSEPFVLNPAHPETVDRTIRHCKKAIKLCADLEQSIYSMHPGVALNLASEDLGNRQNHLKSFDFDESRKILINACLELADFARQNGVQLLLENNVAARFNCPDGINDRYHLADLEESHQLSMLFDLPNLDMLLDTGHLKVSAQTLNFEPLKFVDKFINHIKAVHISENDGISDKNLPVSSNAWFWNCIPWHQVTYVSLEISGQSIDKLGDQLKMVKQQIREVLSHG